jgi:integrase
MTPFRAHGRRIYTAKVPKGDGTWRGVSTGTADGRTARRMQEMIEALGVRGARAWDVLDKVHDGSLTLASLYDHWRDAGRDVDTLRQNLANADLEPMVEAYLKAATCSEDTKDHYRALIRRMMPEGNVFPVSRLNTAIVQKTIDDLKGSPATKRKAGAAIRSFCNWLIARGVIVVNPVRNVRLPRAGRPRTLYLETADAIRLADAQAHPYREFSALLAGTGIEVSVAMKLRKRDVDTENREIRAAGTKTYSRDRIVRVADWAWPYVLDALKGKFPDSLLFDGIPNRWTAGDVHRAAIKKLEKKFPVFKGYTMRDARHTYAVRAVRAGTPADIIARQLGHATPTLLLTVYGRFAPSQDERSKWERIAAAMDSTALSATKKK